MASHNHSMHPHGFRYTKPSEGLASLEQDFGGNSVPPNATWTYTWQVPVGASIVYRHGELAKHTLDVPAPPSSSLTEEVLTLFLIDDENRSYYIDENALTKTNITEGEL
ncbi:hypothetical protein LTR66_007668 [Elasticomyces elasticus]|nr:hypothetical protein LTR66_007668 [Elasticomyces elasticus]